MRLFFDANILFSAAHTPTGKASFLIRAAQEKNWGMFSCELAIEEAKRNLANKSPEGSVRLPTILKSISSVPTVVRGVSPVKLPAEDRSILLSALAVKCTHLLTGDLRHFGPLMNRPEMTSGLIVQTVSDFLRALSEE